MVHSIDSSSASQCQSPQNVFCAWLVRLGLVKPGSAAVVAGAAFFVALTFLPLVIICLWHSTAFPGTAKMPLFLDYSTLTRYLIVGPCLVISDAITKPWLLKVTQNFVSQHIVSSEHLSEYQRLVDKVFMLRESRKVELALLVLAGVSSYFFNNIVLLSTIQESSWYAVIPQSGPAHLSMAGQWQTFVGQPLFRFVVFNWLFEYLLSVYFYLKVARLPLRITPMHPDNVGGLGFIGLGQAQYCLSAFALSVAFSSVIAETAVTSGAKLQAFTNIGIAWVIIMMLLFLGPLLVFTPALIRTKRDALLTYSNLCQHACDSFIAKWTPVKREYGASLLESGDSSALFDLSSNFQIISQMQVVVFSKQIIIFFLVAIGISALPLVASVIPLDDLARQIIKALT